MTFLLIVFVLAAINTFVLAWSLLRAWRRIAKLEAERDRLDFSNHVYSTQGVFKRDVH